MKRCKLCGEMKLLEGFDKNKAVKDGYDNRCKDCRKAQRAANREVILENNKRYYAENAERLRGYATQYRKNNPEVAQDYRERNRDKRLAYAQQYHDEHQEQHKIYTRQRYQKMRIQRLAYSKKYRMENREQINQAAREYRKTLDKEVVRSRNKRYRWQNIETYRGYWRGYRRRHPEQRKASYHRRRALEQNAPGTFTAAEWQSLCEHYEYRCLCCGASDIQLTPDHIIPLSKGGDNYITNIQPLCFDCNRKKATETIDYRTKDTL